MSIRGGEPRFVTEESPDLSVGCLTSQQHTYSVSWRGHEEECKKLRRTLMSRGRSLLGSLLSSKSVTQKETVLHRTEHVRWKGAGTRWGQRVI